MRKTHLLAAGSFFANLMVFASPVMAAEAEVGEKPGLPQFDATQFPAQLFWLVVTFGLFYLLMHFVALPGVKKTQAKREGIISSELAAAAAANEAAKAMIAHYEKALADARAQAQVTVSEITALAAKDAAAKQSVQQQELAKRLRDAETKIKASRDAAISDMKTNALDLANSIVEKITGMKGQVKA